MPAIDEVLIRIKSIGGKVAAADLSEAESGMKGVGSTAKQVAGVAGIAGLAFGLKDVTQAAIQFQDKQAQLANALKNTGQYSKENMAAVTDAADSLAQHGGFDPTESIDGMQRLVRAHESVAEAVKNETLVTDISRAQGISYTAALKAVMNVEQGRQTGLTRMGVVVNAAKDHQEALAASTKHATDAQKANAKELDAAETKTKTMSLLWQRFGGSVSTYSKTAAGAASNFRNSVDVLGQRVGTFLLPAITGVVLILGKMITYLNENKGALLAVAGAFGGLAALWTGEKLIAFTKWLKDTIILTKAWAAAQWLYNAALDAWEAIQLVLNGELTITEALEAAILLPIIAVIAALVALGVAIYEVVKHWKLIRDAAVAAFKFIENVISDAIKWIGAHWKLLAVIFFGVFGLIVDIVVTHFSAIKKFIGNTVNWIIGIIKTIEKPFQAVFDFIVNNIVVPATKLIVKAIQWVVTQLEGVWKTMEKPVQAALNWILGAFHTVGNAIVNAIRWVVDKVTGLFKTITGPISSIVHGIGSIAHAGGGVVSSIAHFAGLQSGGYTPSGGIFTVGEHGPETLILPAHSTVLPHGMSPGGDGATLENHVTLKIGEKDFARAIAWTTAKEKATH